MPVKMSAILEGRSACSLSFVLQLTLLFASLPASFASWDACSTSYRGSGNNVIVVDVRCTNSTMYLTMNFPGGSHNGARYIWLEYQCFVPSLSSPVSWEMIPNPETYLTVRPSYTQSFEHAPLPEGTVCTVRGCFRSLVGFFFYYTVPHSCKIDRDECDEGTHECNEYNSNCTNTVGSYNCTCHEGFQFDSDGRTCVELEMTEPPTNVSLRHCNPTCEEDEECQLEGVSGHSICVCRPGFNCSSGTLPPTTEPGCNTSGTEEETERADNVVATKTDTGDVLAVGLVLGVPLLVLCLAVVALTVYILWIKHTHKRTLRIMEEKYQLLRLQDTKPFQDTTNLSIPHSKEDVSANDNHFTFLSAVGQRNKTSPLNELNTPSHQLASMRQVQSSPSLSSTGDPSCDQKRTSSSSEKQECGKTITECEGSSDDGMQKNKQDRGFRNFMFTVHHEL